MKTDQVLAASTVVVALVLTAALAYAVDPADRCEAGKVKAIGKYVGCLANLDAKAAITGVAVDPLATAKCADKFLNSWDKAQSRGEGLCSDPPGAEASTAQATAVLCAEWASGHVQGGDPDICAGPCDACMATCNSDLATCNGNLATCNNDLANYVSDLTGCSSNLTTCSDDLATCTGDCAASVRPPIRTGQTACYDVPGAVIPCEGTAQDGDVQKGAVRSFTDNGDGTITDNVTGLMWEKHSNDGSIHDAFNVYFWEQAFSIKVATLNATNFAGYGDWRVPNILELQTLVNFGAVAPSVYSVFDTLCGPGCTVVSCSCTHPANYFSSTTQQDPTSRAWGVTFTGGQTASLQKTSLLRVRAVRGGS